MTKPRAGSSSRLLCLFLVTGCTSEFSPSLTTNPTGEQASETGALVTTTGLPDDPTSSSSGDTGTGRPPDYPCSACGADEYCYSLDPYDCDPEPLFGAPRYECRPLPDGCAQADLCNDLACTIQICSRYECERNSCGYGGWIACIGHCTVDDPNTCPTGTVCLPISYDDDIWWDREECVPVPEPGVPVGGVCTLTGDGDWQWGDCELGALCHLIDEDTGQGVCKRLCGEDDDGMPTCRNPTTACVVWGEESDFEYGFCEPICDPLDPLACSTGDVCVSGSEDPLHPFVCVREFSGDAGATFDSCEYANSCDPGLLCGSLQSACDPNAGGCCTPFCDLTQPACPEGLSCLPYFAPEEAPPGHEDVGVCVE